MTSAVPRGVLALGCALTLTLAAGFAWAEKADRDRPMNVEADALRYDDLKQVSIFTGKVVLTKGTLLIRGERLEVRQDPQGYQFAVVTAAPGQRAFYRQKREALDEFIEGEGQTIDYDGRQDVVKFIGQGVMRRLAGAELQDEFQGNVITYNNLTSVFTLDSGPSQGMPGSQGQAAPPPGRVRAVITPKLRADAAARGPATDSPALQSTPALGGARP